MKFFLSLLLLVVPGYCHAQKELFLTASGGLKVSYNQLKSDKPLPEGVLQHSNWPGFSGAIGLEYKLNPHWAIHAQMKTAGIKIGFAKKRTIIYDTLSLKYNTIKETSGTSANTNYPVHYQVGFTYYSDPVKESKLSWLVGGGVAYLLNDHGISSTIRIAEPVGQPRKGQHYGKEINLAMGEDYFKNGFLLNIHAGIDYNFAARHHLLFTWQYNAGLNTIWKYNSDYFLYIDKTQFNTTVENFDVTLRNKGSYSAFQLGYKYALFAAK